MKAYSFVQYACLFIRQMKVREWLAALKLIIVLFVIIKLMTWVAEELLVLALVFVLYQIVKVIYALAISVLKYSATDMNGISQQH